MAPDLGALLRGAAFQGQKLKRSDRGATEERSEELELCRHDCGLKTSGTDTNLKRRLPKHPRNGAHIEAGGIVQTVYENVLLRYADDGFP